MDIELAIGCRDETYLMTLKHWLKRLEREIGNDKFDLEMFQPASMTWPKIKWTHDDNGKGVGQTQCYVLRPCHRQDIRLFICGLRNHLGEAHESL